MIISGFTNNVQKVKANPELEGGEYTLTGLEVDGEKYAILESDIPAGGEVGQVLGIISQKGQPVINWVDPNPIQLSTNGTLTSNALLNDLIAAADDNDVPEKTYTLYRVYCNDLEDYLENLGLTALQALGVKMGDEEVFLGFNLWSTIGDFSDMPNVTLKKQNIEVTFSLEDGTVNVHLENDITTKPMYVNGEIYFWAIKHPQEEY